MVVGVKRPSLVFRGKRMSAHSNSRSIVESRLRLNNCIFLRLPLDSLWRHGPPVAPLSLCARFMSPVSGERHPLPCIHDDFPSNLSPRASSPLCPTVPLVCMDCRQGPSLATFSITLLFSRHCSQTFMAQKSTNLQQSLGLN